MTASSAAIATGTPRRYPLHKRVSLHVVNHTQPAATDIPDAAPTDAQLIAESAVRPRAFMQLLERHQRILYGYIARRVGPDLAEDIVA
ncbi:MAG: hypothetical protein H7123_08655, partial [Thermoleophilia bacterium]|nr:hypothetical protein [Thermoleophilia bacterium]